MGSVCCRHRGELEINPPVQGVSYSFRLEKIPNNLKSNADISGSSSRLAGPSNADIILSDLKHDRNLAKKESVQNHRKFPLWTKHRKCEHCGCNCRGKTGITKMDIAQAECFAEEDVKNNTKNPYHTLTNLAGHAFANILAMNALELTAPASDALLKNRKNAWVQCAGHPGSFAPAGPNTIWKRRGAKDNNETNAYQMLMQDVAKTIVPEFNGEVEYAGEYYIEMEDLLQHFNDPNVMDIKMGSRTFLESEVKNPVLRKDLYEKMVKLDPDEPTTQEHEQKAITKLRYMQFREQGSSTSTLGFRIEAIKKSGESPNTDLKKIKTEAEVLRCLHRYIGRNAVVRDKVIKRLKEIRTKFEKSQFFMSHEVIGSSLLFMYDSKDNVGVWCIDFAKTLRMEEGKMLTHRAEWSIGNHEDGYLTGLDNLIALCEDLKHSSSKVNFAYEDPEKAHKT